jgi:hypothetical protein
VKQQGRYVASASDGARSLYSEKNSISIPLALVVVRNLQQCLLLLFALFVLLSFSLSYLILALLNTGALIDVERLNIHVLMFHVATCMRLCIDRLVTFLQLRLKA